MLAVELDAVSKCYGDFPALRELSLSVNQGEVIGLLGHNGAGKTTLMKLVLGLIAPSGGRIDVFGHAPRSKGSASLHRQLGYLPESVSFYEQLSGREVLDYFARLKGVNRRARETLLDAVGLAQAAGRRVKTYSKGMRQRLGLAQALLGQPRLLLLDEPTVGLDPMAIRDFYQTLDGLRAQGTTVILCSHVLAGMQEHIDRGVILGAGRLLAMGSLEQLRAQAGLPLRIQVRGHWRDDGWQNGLASVGIQVRRMNGREAELSSAAENKLPAMRSLLAIPGIEDIDVTAPSLEALYASFNAVLATRHSDRQTGDGTCEP